MLFKELSYFEKDMLLAFFMNYMTLEQRYKLMNTMPEAYNHLVEKRIMESIRIEDDTDDDLE